MTSLVALSAYLPPNPAPIGSIQDALRLSTPELRLFERYYGLSAVSRDKDGQLADLLISAAEGLPRDNSWPQRVRYLVESRTLQAVAPYPINPLLTVRTKLGLEHSQVFAVTQHACASGLLAVDLCGRLLAADGDPDALALILTGEKAFTPTARVIPGTAVMGEGAAAVLVSAADGPNRVLGYATQSHGRFNEGLSLPPQLGVEFQRIYPEALAEVLDAALGQAGIGFDDVDLVLPHNVNRVSWVRLAKHLGVPVERLYLDNIPATGHCFCADPFLNLATATTDGRIRPGDRVLMAAVGLGATFSAMVVEH